MRPVWESGRRRAFVLRNPTKHRHFSEQACGSGTGIMVTHNNNSADLSPVLDSSKAHCNPETPLLLLLLLLLLVIPLMTLWLVAHGNTFYLWLLIN